MPTIPHSLADVSFDHSCYSPLGGTGVGSSDPNIVEFLGDLGASFFRRSRTVPGWRRSYFDQQGSPTLGETSLSLAFREVVSLLIRYRFLRFCVGDIALYAGIRMFSSPVMPHPL